MPYDPLRYGDAVSDRARFAETFKDTTDLDQRRRYAQDISEAKVRDDERRKQEFQDLQRRNPAVKEAETKRMAENRLLDESLTKADLAERRFTWDQEKNFRTNQIDLKKAQVEQMKEQRLFDKADRELTDAARIEADTSAVEQAEFNLRDKGLYPGTKGYRDGLLNALAHAPNINPGFRSTLVDQAGIKMDANELQQTLAGLKETNPNASFTVGSDGKVTIHQPAAKADKPVDLQAQLDKAYAAREKAKKSEDEDYRIYTEDRIRTLESQLKGNQPQTPTSTAKEGGQTSTVWRVGKEGTRWEYDATTKQPTGKFEK